MPTHAEQRPMPYTREQLFDLVADIERYPEFLPWVTAARINKRDGDVLWADLVVGFKMIRERYTSRVELSRPERVDVTYEKGPFRYLNNHWVFIPRDDGSTVIDFYLDFEFKSKMLQRIMGSVFSEAVRLMVHSFEKRAQEVYGPDGRVSAEG